MIWLLGGYMWLFIHRPFEVWPWLGVMHIERIYMLVTILYWALAAEKHWIPSQLSLAFAFFWIVMLASCLLSPFDSSVEGYFKVAVFYVLAITSIRDDRNLRLLVIMFLGAMALYMLHSYREYLCGRYIQRMGVARMIGVDTTYNDPNTFSATILYSLPILLSAWALANNHWQRGLLLSYAGLAVLCILLTGSRSSFAGLCFLCLVAALFSKYRVRILAALVVAAPVIWLSLRGDLQNRFLTLVDPSFGPASAQASAESRGQGWHDGVRIWKEHPLLGAGPGAFGAARGGRLQDLQAHNLYGQVLGELGMFGAVAFSAVLLGFFANYLHVRRICQQQPDLCDSFSARLIQAVTMTVILLLLMGFGAHNLYRYTWLWFSAFEAVALHLLLTRKNELTVVESESADDPVAAACT